MTDFVVPIEGAPLKSILNFKWHKHTKMAFREMTVISSNDTLFHTHAVPIQHMAVRNGATAWPLVPYPLNTCPFGTGRLAPVEIQFFICRLNSHMRMSKTVGLELVYAHVGGSGKTGALWKKINQPKLTTQCFEA